jgi:hypothetical protein
VDTIDSAQSTADTFLDAALKNARPKGRALLPKGDCYYCKEKVEGLKLFCDMDCMEDYEKLQRKLKNLPE